MEVLNNAEILLKAVREKIRLLMKSYEFLMMEICIAEKSGNYQNDFRSIVFEDILNNETFKVETYLSNREFEDSLFELVLRTKDSIELQKIYYLFELLFNKELETGYEGIFDGNYNYFIHNDLFSDDTNYFLFSFINSAKPGKNGEPDFFCTDNYLQSLISEITEMKNIVDRLFTIKELNKIQVQSTKINSTLIQEPIYWKGDTKRDIAYIFWQLRKMNLIECKSLGLTLSKIFYLDSEPISNGYFNAEFSKFERGEYPTNAFELDKILLKPKKNITKLK